jgi:hypothetical protein
VIYALEGEYYIIEVGFSSNKTFLFVCTQISLSENNFLIFTKCVRVEKHPDKLLHPILSPEIKVYRVDRN